MAWDYTLSADALAEEWIRQTFSNSNDLKVIDVIKNIMLASAEAAVNYRESLGLIHIGTGSHYGPAPWSERSKRFHCADEKGIGYNRSANGSNAAGQYNSPLKEEFNDINNVPEKYLLWFHHVDWNHKMKSGRTLWSELVHKL